MDVSLALLSMFFVLGSTVALMLWVGSLHITMLRLFVLPVGLSYSAILLWKGADVFFDRIQLGAMLSHAIFPLLFAFSLYLFFGAFIQKETPLHEFSNKLSEEKPVWGFVIYLLGLFLYMMLDVQSGGFQPERSVQFIKPVPLFFIVVLSFFVSVPFGSRRETDSQSKAVYTLIAWRRNSLVLTGVSVCGAMILFCRSLEFDTPLSAIFLYACVVHIACTGLLAQHNSSQGSKMNSGLLGLIALFIFCVFWLRGAAASSHLNSLGV